MILTRKIFGDEAEKVDGCPAHPIDHPAKDKETSVGHQDQESGTEEQSGEGESEGKAGKANETSKSMSIWFHVKLLSLNFTQARPSSFSPRR